MEMNKFDNEEQCLHFHGRAWVINLGGDTFMRDRIMDFFSTFFRLTKNLLQLLTFYLLLHFLSFFTHVMYQFTIYFD